MTGNPPENRKLMERDPARRDGCLPLVAVGSTNPVKVGAARRIFAQFLLPPSIEEAVRPGGEVGAIVREDAFAMMVAAALVRFFHPELYET